MSMKRATFAFVLAVGFAVAAAPPSLLAQPKSEEVQPLPTRSLGGVERVRPMPRGGDPAPAPTQRSPQLTRELPREAFSPADAALPAGTTTVDAATFDRLRAEGRLDYTSPAISREAIERGDIERAGIRQKLATQLRGHQDVLARVTAKPRADKRNLRQRQDGSYELRLRNDRTVVLENEDFLAREVSDSLEALAKPATHQRNYDLLRSRIAERVTDQRTRARLFARLPASGREMRTIGQLDKATALLVTRFLDYLVQQESEPEEPSLPGPPAGYVANCAQEEGAGSGLDRTGNCTYSEIGLHANAHWPLKYRTTCVKDQGMRGTCVAFAITGAVEAVAARKYNRWTNLSEQHLYYNEKSQWFSSIPPNFGDGLIPPFSVAGLMLGSYRYAFEDAWEYNKSLQREEVINLPFEFTYRNSCTGYNGTHCSDTNHQGQLVCTQKCLGVAPLQHCWNECGYTANVAATAGFRVGSFNPFFNIINPQHGVDMAKAFLAAGAPVVASLAVVESFDNVSNDGYVSYVSGNESSRGGHAVVLTGWVPNSQRPDGAPSGAGGGYFVGKNSWGCNSGDAGYYYLPASWVMKNVYSMLALEDVTT